MITGSHCQSYILGYLHTWRSKQVQIISLRWALLVTNVIKLWWTFLAIHGLTINHHSFKVNTISSTWQLFDLVLKCYGWYNDLLQQYHTHLAHFVCDLVLCCVVLCCVLHSRAIACGGRGGPRPQNFPNFVKFCIVNEILAPRRNPQATALHIHWIWPHRIWLVILFDYKAGAWP